VISLEQSINYKVGEILQVAVIDGGKLGCKGKPCNKYDIKPFTCFAHATPEEINKHLASICPDMRISSYPVRDRSTDDLSNFGLPTKPPSYMFEKELMHKEFSSKSKLILSIDNEELPMVNIIKTKTVNLLNNN